MSGAAHGEPTGASVWASRGSGGLAPEESLAVMASRTVERDGWRFDIGGHPSFLKVKEVEAFWHETLDDEDSCSGPA